MLNNEIYNNILSSHYSKNKRSPEYYVEFIEKYLKNKYKKILYLKDEVVLKEDIVDDYFYFIEKGKVVLTKQNYYGKKSCYGYLTEGDFFGYSAFSYLSEVVGYKALTNCYIYAIEVKAAKELVSQSEEFKNEVHYIFVDTLRTLTLRQGSLASGECKTSFVNFIFEYFKNYSKIDEKGNIVVNLDLTLSQIAEILNMTRETLSRILAEMKKDKIIETKRKYIKILDLSRFIV
ncbi:transcriptional regulator, Crp/Fnr family [Caloramator quimbayensis]|uniref:Transcriptional regulator, Crp/Fnr family n=1 Tax=Caloramator quimbayensis TaxID=1147123 RepID=A0A1T4WEI9_9CLOT|nr:Crp/Fnr family transcriptional regulator [Caloramator quimbayensis]SKA75438.1 transcriptional regulator, Crp/Fnr family [Caloramator quimbayensis]